MSKKNTAPDTEDLMDHLHSNLPTTEELMDHLHSNLETQLRSLDNEIQDLQSQHEDIKKLCAFLRISEEHFHEIEERFRNRDIWSFENGRWVIRDFIISDWEWK